MREFGISPGQFSLLVGSYSLFAGISGFLASFYADLFDRKHNLLFMFAGFIVATLLCGFAPNYSTLLIFRSTAGFFGGVMGSLMLSILGDTIEFERRGFAMGILTTAFSVASIFGVPFSLFLAQKFSWHAPFIFLASLSVIVWVMAYFFIPNIRSHLGAKRTGTWFQQTISPLKTLFSEPNPKWALIFAFSVMLAHFMIIPFISPSLVANASFAESSLPLVYLVGGICSIVSSPFIGRASDRFGKSRMFIFGQFLSIIPVLLMTHMWPLPMSFILIVIGFFFVSAGARMIPSQTLISQAPPPKLRGTFMSLVSCVQSIAMGLGSLIAGQLITKDDLTGRLVGYTTVGYIAIALGLVSLFFIKKLSKLESNSDPVPLQK